MSDITSEIIELWAEINPVAGYAAGHTSAIKSLFFHTPDNVRSMQTRINLLLQRIAELPTQDLQQTCRCLLLAMRSQLDLTRPSGMGPTRTGASGVMAAADGLFYILHFEQARADFVPAYLGVVDRMIVFEIQRWDGDDFNSATCLECLYTARYMEGLLTTLAQQNPKQSNKIEIILNTLTSYKAMVNFAVDVDTGSSEACAVSLAYNRVWPGVVKCDAHYGPLRTSGYPAVFQNYYDLAENVQSVAIQTYSWFEADIAAARSLADRIVHILGLAEGASLSLVWEAVGTRYKVAARDYIDQILHLTATVGNGIVVQPNVREQIELHDMPDYLQCLSPSGAALSVLGLSRTPRAVVYLDLEKEQSLFSLMLTAVNQMSRAAGFVAASQQKQSRVLGLAASLRVPVSEGRALVREQDCCTRAAALMHKRERTADEDAFLQLFGDTSSERREALICLEFELYMRRITAYVRAMCDVRYHGGLCTYSDFIAWASEITSLSPAYLHAQCAPYMGAPGFAPCAVLAGLKYAHLEAQARSNGRTRSSFDVRVAEGGFHAWGITHAHMKAFAERPSEGAVRRSA